MMTRRYARLIAAAILIAACSAPISAQQDTLEELRAKAEQGDAYAQFDLGVMYARGEGVPQYLPEGAHWFRQAAEQGHAGAQYLLGTMYMRGEGVPLVFAEAERLYRLAAEAGILPAQLDLGREYSAVGLRLRGDNAESERWYRLAAEQGSAEAMESLGTIYWVGLGVPRDRVQAHMWIDLASARLQSRGDRDRAASDRLNLAGEMSQDQVAEAQRLAREWDAAHPRE